MQRCALASVVSMKSRTQTCRAFDAATYDILCHDRTTGLRGDLMGFAVIEGDRLGAISFPIFQALLVVYRASVIYKCVCVCAGVYVTGNACRSVTSESNTNWTSGTNKVYSILNWFQCFAPSVIPWNETCDSIILCFLVRIGESFMQIVMHCVRPRINGNLTNSDNNSSI